MIYIILGLPWSSLVGPLGTADDALSRLDEQLRVSPIREGWIARTHFLDARASAWIDGELNVIKSWCDLSMSLRADGRSSPIGELEETGIRSKPRVR